MGQGIVAGIIEVRRLEQSFPSKHALHLLYAAVGDGDGFLFQVNREIRVLHQAGNHPGEGLVLLRRFFSRAADDKRSPGFVNEYVVHFIHDGVVQRALHALVEVDHHVVPQVVEAELVVGAVSDISIVSLLAGYRLQAAPSGIFGFGFVLRVILKGSFVLNGGHAQAQSVKDGPHPVAIPFGQVVVDGDQMAAFAGDGVEVQRQGGH